MGLYYLKSRFYNPITGRFISPDDTKYLQTDVVNGLNLFAYCGNNPVMNVDPNANSFLASLIIGAAIGFFTSYVPDVVSEMQDGFEWSDFNTFGDNWQKYLGSTLGGAIGGIGSGLGLSVLTISKGAKQSLNKIYDELYNAYGYNSMEKTISNMYNFITGWIF